MSTSSVIGSMQSALNCASRCDCCDKLQQQINAINTKIAGLKNVDENALKLSIKSSLEPSFLSVAAGAAAVSVNKLQPQVDAAKKAATDAFLEIAENTRKQRLLEIEMQGARDIATRAERNAAEYARQMRLAQQDALNAAREQAIKNNRVNRDFELSQAELRTLAAKNEREAERLAQIDRKTSARLGNLESEIPSLSARIGNVASDAELAKGLANQSISKAGQVAQDVAKVSSATINTANDVNGLRQFVNSIGSRVNALGEAIGKVESAVATAVTNAAKAIGISEQALGKVIGLAGKVLEIFNVIGTIFTILDGMATRIVLGERIDAVERELQFQGDSISGILGKLLGFQNRIGRNEATIADVRTIAVDAQRTADKATNKAQAAYVLGGKADGEARQAQLTADGAVRNASIANENATTAYKQGIKAENIEQQALRVGSDALGKAGFALETALTAVSLYQGIKLLRGLQGIPGIPGRKGDKGDKGDQGLPGITTVIQIPGVPGKDGKNGAPGISGRNGRDVNPADLASLRALIVQQHGITRTNINATTTGLFGKLQLFIAAGNTAITGLMTAIATNTYVEKAMQLLTLAATLHNAAMLSNNLAQTLGTIINQCVGFILPKGINGQPINITDVIGHTIEDIVKQAIGDDNYTTITTDWAKANRIYQAGANVFNQVSNAVGILTSGLEMIGGNIGKIGNALKIWGVVGQHAYNFMNPQPNMKGKFFDFINNATLEANTIQMMVAIPIGLASAGAAINESADAFTKALDQTDPVDSMGHPIQNPDGSIKKYIPGLTIPDPVLTVAAQAKAQADSTNIIQATIDDIFNAND